MGFKENLKRLREQKGWTQTQAAEQAGVPFRTMQNWEAGSREPRLEALKKLAAAYGVTVDNLLKEDSESARKPVRAVPGTPPAADLETEGQKAHSQKTRGGGKPAAAKPKKPRGRLQ